MWRMHFNKQSIYCDGLSKPMDKSSQLILEHPRVPQNTLYLRAYILELFGGAESKTRLRLHYGPNNTLRVCLLDQPNSDFPTSAKILLFGRPVLSHGHCRFSPKRPPSPAWVRISNRASLLSTSGLDRKLAPPPSHLPTQPEICRGQPPPAHSPPRTPLYVHSSSPATWRPQTLLAKWPPPTGYLAVPQAHSPFKRHWEWSSS
jgi:hypothetical protein